MGTTRRDRPTALPEAGVDRDWAALSPRGRVETRILRRITRRDNKSSRCEIAVLRFV